MHPFYHDPGLVHVHIPNILELSFDKSSSIVKEETEDWRRILLA